MGTTVCYYSDHLHYSEGGYLWKFLNWASGLRTLGCRVLWLEAVPPTAALHEVRATVAALKQLLEPYGFSEAVALCSKTCEPLPAGAGDDCLDLEVAAEADLLLNVGHYGITPEIVSRFRRSALVDYDPGLLQIWMTRAGLRVARHSVNFTIGETVGQPGARFPDGGIRWEYVPPCVALDRWPPHRAGEIEAFTTVSHWWGEWLDDYPNNKRAGFLPFLDLPRLTSQRLELALCLGKDEDGEGQALRKRGWLVRDANEVAPSPWDYQRYIQQSLGEFSCAKPSCVRLQNAWISERTLCYLASGKPAVVQHTGPSRFLPDAAGLFRFQTLQDAARCLEAAATDYERHGRLARALAEEYFDARKVGGRVLERALA